MVAGGSRFSATGYDLGLDAQDFYLGLALDVEYVEGFVEGCPERIGEEDDPDEEDFLRGIREDGDDPGFVLEALKNPLAGPAPRRHFQEFGCVPSGRRVAHRLNIVAVRIQDEGPVILGVVLRSQPRSAIVSTTSAQRRLVERVDPLTSIGVERNMDSRRVRFALGDPEVRLPPLPETGHRSVKLEQQLVPKWS